MISELNHTSRFLTTSAGLREFPSILTGKNLASLARWTLELKTTNSVLGWSPVFHIPTNIRKEKSFVNTRRVIVDSLNEKFSEMLAIKLFYTIISVTLWNVELYLSICQPRRDK